MADNQPVRLRAAYRRHLDAYASELQTMAELARLSMLHATRALLEQDLEASEEAITESDKLVEVHRRCQDQAMSLLARQHPVASELRQIMSYVHMETDLARMGNMAKMVAKIARQHHPDPALPEGAVHHLVTAAEVCDRLAAQVCELLGEPDAETALEMEVWDDEVDAATRALTAAAIADDWPGSIRQAVETALAARYYERFADHCVGISRHVVFMVSGQRPARGE